MSEDRIPGGSVPPEEGSRRIWWIAAAVLVVLVALRFAPRIENPLRPRPRAAYVAIQLDEGGPAADGMVEIEAGRPFRLFAVLEAETFGGGTVFFTEAPALRLDGRDVAPEAIRPWPEDRPARVRWLTVEGASPFLRVEGAEELDFRLVETYHAEWGTRWSAAGAVDPRLAQLPPGSPLRPLPFGTQRFAARIEIYRNEEALTPSGRWASSGAEGLLSGAEPGTGVIARLPPPLHSVSGAVGRTGLELAEGSGPAARERADELVARGFAVFETGLLAAHLRESGREATDLRFETVELGPEGPRWGREVGPGDLVGAGDRVLVLWRDRGVPGRLDPVDLAFDPHRGVQIVSVGDVFPPGDGLRLDLAPVAEKGG